MSEFESPQGLVLLTGATGYVGGRLRRVLEEKGYPVRCLARNPSFLHGRTAAGTSVVRGDLLDVPSLDSAMEGVESAFYLVHSMEGSADFETVDSIAARNFAASAKRQGVRKIIYLGGLGHGECLSPHLASRQDVGRILRESGIPTIELRSSIIIGSGSLSFEMIRALVEKLPVMITPAWVRELAQPIAIEDILQYLTEALSPALTTSEVFEIGGSDQVSYGGIMQEYARQKGLRRKILPVPVLSLRLSSLWLGLVTPIYSRTGRKLIDSVRHSTIVRNQSALTRFLVRPRGIREAIQRALSNEDREFAETRWCDALSSTAASGNFGGFKYGPRLIDSRALELAVPAASAFLPIRRIGGRSGWYYGNFLWGLRGFLDRLVGGPGMRRGRRHPDELLAGEAVDFWRVEAFEPDRLLRLCAEMKVPGRAWLQFEVQPLGDGTKSVIRQTALFDPLGLAGLAYWYLAYPAHRLIFQGMLERIGDSAVREYRKLGAKAST